MFTIRRNVFETNSSSMHSVSYSPKKDSEQLDLEKLKKEYNGKKIIGTFGEFGWGYDLLVSLEEKLSYVLTSIRYFDHYLDDDEPNVLESIKESKYFKWLKELFDEYLGCELDLELADTNYYKIGYVDHQSTDTLDDYMSENEEEFKTNMLRLLLDDGYTIIIDNDNH